MVKDANVLILGITFKENCPDIRNTKVVDIYNTLLEYTPNITVFDPWANKDHVKEEYGIEITTQLSSLTPQLYDAVILAVSHQQFLEMDVKTLVKDGGVIYDVKGILPRTIVDGRL
jgi:UDP-N-acetyl-D-galactosamine dehydrogenase